MLGQGSSGVLPASMCFPESIRMGKRLRFSATGLQIPGQQVSLSPFKGIEGKGG